MMLSIALLVPLLVLLVVSMFAFAGCGHLLPTDAPPEEPAPKPAPAPVPTPTPTPTPTVTTYSEDIGAEMGLRGYWRLGEAPGTTVAADSKPVVAQRRPGTYTATGVTLGEAGVLRLGKDPTDTAATFDGQGFVEIDVHDDVVNPPMSFSIEAWVRPSFTGASTGVVVGSNEGLPERRGFVLEVVRDAAGALKAQARVGGGGLASTTLQADLGPGTTLDGWRHVVATYSGPLKELKLYVGAGVLPSVATAPGPVDYKAADTANDPFRIGAGRNESSSPLPGTPVPPANLFIGRIDEVALYDRALDAATVAAHFSKATTP